MISASQDQLSRLLELVEEHIDLDHCYEVDDRFRRSLKYEEVDAPPLVVLSHYEDDWELPAPWNEFDLYSYSQWFNDPLAMLQGQLLDRVVPGLILKDDCPLALRSHHGTIQIASLLGCEWGMHEDDHPWIKPLGSAEAIRHLIQEDSEIDFQRGVFSQSVQTLEFFRDQLGRYERCKQAIQISMTDLQGPVDTAHQMWGTEMMLATMTEPELVHSLMDKIVCAMTRAADHFRDYTFDRLDPVAHTQHGYMMPGRITIRNDSSIMVSPDTYREIAAPHDAKLLETYGGGTIHFCGNGEHLVEPFLELPNIRGLDLGQANMMNTERIYGLCREKKVAITHLEPSREDLISGQAIRDFPTGVVFVYRTENLDDAREVVQAYQRRALSGC